MPGPAPKFWQIKRKRRLGTCAVAALALGFGAIPLAHSAGILSQGTNAGVSAVTSSVTSTLAAEQQANIVAAQAQNQLSRVTTALQAMQTMQSAARSLALSAPSAVPDGLQLGGLVPDSGLKAPGRRQSRHQLGRRQHPDPGSFRRQDHGHDQTDRGAGFAELERFQRQQEHDGGFQPAGATPPGRP